MLRHRFCLAEFLCSIERLVKGKNVFTALAYLDSMEEAVFRLIEFFSKHQTLWFSVSFDILCLAKKIRPLSPSFSLQLHFECRMSSGFLFFPPPTSWRVTSTIFSHLTIPICKLTVKWCWTRRLNFALACVQNGTSQKKEEEEEKDCLFVVLACSLSRLPAAAAVPHGFGGVNAEFMPASDRVPSSAAAAAQLAKMAGVVATAK